MEDEKKVKEGAPGEQGRVGGWQHPMSQIRQSCWRGGSGWSACNGPRSQSCWLHLDSPQAFTFSSQWHPRRQQPLPGLLFAGALPFSAGSLLVYMNLEKLWNGPRDRFSPLQNFANVCLAAAVTQTLSYPFDTVKRKMQVRSIWGRGASGRRGALLCLRAVVTAKNSDPE